MAAHFLCLQVFQGEDGDENDPDGGFKERWLRSTGLLLGDDLLDGKNQCQRSDDSILVAGLDRRRRSFLCSGESAEGAYLELAVKIMGCICIEVESSLDYGAKNSFSRTADNWTFCQWAIAYQCYDKYLQKSLRKAAEARGHSFWARGPDNAGHYNSQPQDTGFFCDGGDYDSYYGRFFLRWYSQVLIEHGDRMLALANLAFEGTRIAAKVSGIHWWYKTASHAAEITAGFYNPSNLDGYAPICQMLKKHDAAFNFTCVELRTLAQEELFPEAMADPEGLVWQVLNAAWDAGISVISENAVPCHDRDGYNKILENAKPKNDPDGRHLIAFTYLRLSPTLMERVNFCEFDRFVKRMHGEAVLDVRV